MNFIFSGPRLGPHYDFLRKFRPLPPASGELLLIETNRASPLGKSGAPSALGSRALEDNILEPSLMASVMLTMTELEAASLIIQTPVLGLSAGTEGSGEDILYRFNEEFGLLTQNIQNLFEAIRMGSVPPDETARYVEELVNLAEDGKERLVTGLVRRDQEGMARFEKAAAAFGNVRQPGDLQVRVIRAGGAEGDPDETGEKVRAVPDTGAGEGTAFPGLRKSRSSREYSRTAPDRDGVLRRIAPVLNPEDPASTEEHIVYAALKGRYRSSGIEYAESGPFLWNWISPESLPKIDPVVSQKLSFGGTAIPLDRKGSLIFEPPEDFRRLSLALFLEYEEADKSLRRVLGEAEARGLYQGLEGENYPPILYDYALELRNDLMEEPSGENRFRWTAARNAYFKAIDNLLHGPFESRLVNSIVENIASVPGEEKIRELIHRRDTLILAFADLRSAYNETLEMRNVLGKALAGSFCVLGPASSREEAGPTDAEASIILANSILSARALSPEPEPHSLLAALGCAFFISLVIHRTGVFISLTLGLTLSLLSLAGFSGFFIITGRWLDPLIPASSCWAGIFFSCLCALGMKYRFSRHFRLTYGPYVSRSCLGQLIRAGKPLPAETVLVRAAIITIRETQLISREDRDNPEASARAILEFRENAGELIKEAGGTLAGCEGGLIMAAFGSPLERAPQGRRHTPLGQGDPAVKAADITVELASIPACASWSIGLDAGECAFTWSALSGYSVFGRPVVRSRLLSGLAPRYKAQVLVSGAVRDRIEIPVQRLDVLKAQDGLEREPFYKLVLHP
jgi:IMP dehydrogenase/GMP reductase